MMRETSQMHTILLALQLLRMFALFTIVYLQRLIVASDDRKLARVVKIERSDGSLWISCSETLSWHPIISFV